MEANVAVASNGGSFEECFRTLFPAVARTAALVCRDFPSGSAIVPHERQHPEST
jgi:hypothetical protein